MKKVFLKLALLTLVIGVALINNSCGATFIKEGNGVLVISEQDLPEFEKINISGFAEVHFYESDEYRTVLIIDENLEKYVDIFVEGNTLKIKTKNGSYIFTKFLVEVYCPASLTGVTLSGSGNFYGKDAIVTSTFNAAISGSGDIKCDVECSSNISATITGSGNMRGDFACQDFSAKIDGSGDMRGKVECQKFSAKIIGSGNISIAGSGQEADITISGSGDFGGYDFIMKNATISISGSGNANVFVTDYLKATIYGSGNINYKGNPQVDAYVTGSGKIKKM